ncbi:hypothetical protein [Sedimentibacter sp. MB31-C6]|uniref:hypothetical protein n=1 Tax=Sedimentibacter sp. MB31-C6 TaxID=3109366 RepID=UPI002DDCB33D|nr:hypothetical protein [Sedimentibacter sp. MB36-C1]WSI04178.1 hypothetical protein U8307_14430 [Sedimentibacter sp. MB36-C1]
MELNKFIWVGLILIGILGILIEIKFKTVNFLSILISIICILTGLFLRKKIFF